MVRNILILILALNSLFISAQVKFDASVSKTKLGLNERLRVDFIMNQNGDNFSPPDFENFQIIELIEFYIHCNTKNKYYYCYSYCCHHHYYYRYCSHAFLL